MNLSASHPQRIVCLTAESAEVLWRIGAWDRVVGVSGYTVRPPEARGKPKVGAFTTIRVDKVLALQPDLVVSFSDLQAEHVKTLVAAGCNVLAMNQRSLEETLQAILVLGGAVGQPGEAARLAAELRREFEAAAEKAAGLPFRPRVFFEEWPDPLISGIRWVSELIELAGGEDVFPELVHQQGARSRTVTADAVRQRNPDVIVASWCGKKVRFERIYHRPGWEGITAIQRRQVYEVKSAHILQPGPVLVEGLRELQSIIQEVAYGM